MTKEQLSCFIALAETENFSRASRRSFVSPSAFSRIIQRMEDELGAALCIRNNREVILTPAGERFLAYARQSLNQWKELYEGIHDREEDLSGELSIFATVTACYSILPSMLKPFRRRHPGVNIHLRTGDAADALDMVRNDMVDCSIAPIPDGGVQDLFIEQLTGTSLVFVAPGAEQAAGLDLDGFPRHVDWEKLPLILPERGLARQRIDRWFRRMEISPNIYAQVAGNEGILSMVTLDLGIGLIPELVVTNSLMAEGLRILPYIDELADFMVGIAARRRAAVLPNVAEFIRSAREGFAEVQ